MLVDREEEGLPHLDPGAADPELAVLARNYRGSALLQLGDLDGRTALLDSVAAARELGQHEYVMRGYYNLAEGLWRLGRHAEAARYLDAADEYGRDRDFQAHSYFVTARQQRLRLMRGEWEPAGQVLRSLLAQRPDPGMLGRETVPVLARLLVRQGADEAPRLLDAAARAAREADVLEWLVPTGLAHLEQAWLRGAASDRARTGSGPAADWAALLRARTDRRGAAHFRGELVRWLRRLGEPVTSFPGCPPEFAAGIDGDWRAAAAEWERIGDPYERALELLESGAPEPTLAALAVLDGLGARPAAALARRRLRELGVAAVPRGPAAATRTNPAGLTERQVEILRLLASGMTNAEIAARLVVSVRTVDIHRGGGRPKKLSCIEVVGGPHDDLVALGEDVVDRPPLPHATDVVEQHAQALPAGGQVRRPALHRPRRADQRGERGDVAVADQVQEPHREALVRGQGVGRGRAGHRGPPRSCGGRTEDGAKGAGDGSGSDAHPAPGPA